MIIDAHEDMLKTGAMPLAVPDLLYSSEMELRRYTIIVLYRPLRVHYCNISLNAPVPSPFHNRLLFHTTRLVQSCCAAVVLKE